MKIKNLVFALIGVIVIYNGQASLASIEKPILLQSTIIESKYPLAFAKKPLLYSTNGAKSCDEESPSSCSQGTCPPKQTCKKKFGRCICAPN